MSSTTAPPPPPAHLVVRHPLDIPVSRSVKTSLFLHVLIAVLFMFKTTFYPGDPVRVVPTLRVDLVGLPDILKKDRAMLQNTVPALEQALKDAQQDAQDIKKGVKIKVPELIANKDEMVLKPKPGSKGEDREKRLKNALSRIKSLARLEKLEDPASDTKLPSAIIKGNQTSKGTSLSGEARESATASYYDQVQGRLQDFWELPIWLARQKLSAVIMILIDNRGYIRQAKFVRSSGNAQFDEAIKKTLQNSQPLPPPPEPLADAMAEQGLKVGFPL